ncbi:type II toxin-antitoxin system RelE/ParE family toxin [Bradyrhizobium iriomotense]|uniref:type II toxin-antitoxin system RelE/ParE family toxin n=1 Tax=Bradyrhizobium iriomotense TaxID=441950 RepID=UPI0024BF9F73|nr:type II toxin-antitoxin system RelE/ParE family toxin [Bradyrhizobium iriomotense]
MRVVWTREALADLADIATYYASNASPAIADAIGQRFADVIERVRGRLSHRHGSHTVPRSAW